MRVNRAFALGQAKGAEAGLSLLAQSDIDASAYPYVHLVRASLLAEAGRPEAARTDLAQAVGHARNVHERRQIERLERRLGRQAQ